MGIILKTTAVPLTMGGVIVILKWWDWGETLRKVIIRNLEIGTGMPKICVPIMGEGVPAIISEIKEASVLPIDLIEWRMDYFFDNPEEVIKSVFEECGNIPVLCTMRTVHDGGKADVNYNKYEECISSIIDTGFLDAVDIEFSAGEDIVRRLIEKARKKGIVTVVSKHDFEKTPAAEDIAADLIKMQQLGADIPKYAVMPVSRKDVIELLHASIIADESAGPITAISMGELGKITRIAGEYFGSAITFASSGEASAPGQLPAEDLYAIMQDMKI